MAPQTNIGVKLTTKVSSSALAAEHKNVAVADKPAPVMRTQLRFDAARLREVFDATAHLPRRHHALAVTSKPGSGDPLLDAAAASPDEEMDYCVVNEVFRGTYVEEVLDSLPFRFGRTRLLTIEPQRCYPVHSDPNFRYHIAIDTHPYTYLLFPVQNVSYNIPSDGYLYRMDARYLHTAINCGPTPRTHLVIIGEEP